MVTSVLVVDNDPSFRLAVTTLLQSRGFTVSGYAWSQGEALVALSRLNPDAVLLDVCLDGPDGLDTVRALRETGWVGPVLLTSSNAEVVSNSMALQAGATGFVPKEDLVGTDLAAYLRP